MILLDSRDTQQRENSSSESDTSDTLQSESQTRSGRYWEDEVASEDEDMNTDQTSVSSGSEEYAESNHTSSFRSAQAKVTLSSIHHYTVTRSGQDLLSSAHGDLVNDFRLIPYSPRNIEFPSINAPNTDMDLIPLLIAAQQTPKSLFPIIAQEDAVKLHINITTLFRTKEEGITYSKKELRCLLLDLHGAVEAFFEHNKDALGIHRVQKKRTKKSNNGHGYIILELARIEESSPLYSKDHLGILDSIDLNVTIDALNSTGSLLTYALVSKITDQLVLFSRKHLVQRYKALFNGAYRSRMNNVLEHVESMSSTMSEMEIQLERYKRSEENQEDSIDYSTVSLPLQDITSNLIFTENELEKQKQGTRKLRSEILRKDADANFCASFKSDCEKNVYTGKSKRLELRRLPIRSSSRLSPRRRECRTSLGSSWSDDHPNSSINNSPPNSQRLQNVSASPPRANSNASDLHVEQNDDIDMIVPLPPQAMMLQSDGAKKGQHICPRIDAPGEYVIRTRSDSEHRQQVQRNNCKHGDLTSSEQRVMAKHELRNKRKREVLPIGAVEEVKVEGPRSTRKVNSNSIDEDMDEADNSQRPLLKSPGPSSLLMTPLEKVSKRAQTSKQQEPLPINKPLKQEAEEEVEERARMDKADLRKEVSIKHEDVAMNEVLDAKATLLGGSISSSVTNIDNKDKEVVRLEISNASFALIRRQMQLSNRDREEDSKHTLKVEKEEDSDIVMKQEDQETIEIDDSEKLDNASMTEKLSPEAAAAAIATSTSFASTGINQEIIVIEDDSEDGQLQIVRTIIKGSAERPICIDETDEDG